MAYRITKLNHERLAEFFCFRLHYILIFQLPTTFQ